MLAHGARLVQQMMVKGGIRAGNGMDIELRLLRSFIALYDPGWVSRAAERTRCTQQAMSMRLKMLETEIGAPLFLRRPTALAPAPRRAKLGARALGVLSSNAEVMSPPPARAPAE